MFFRKFFKKPPQNSQPQSSQPQSSQQMPGWVNFLPYIVPLLSPQLQEPALHLWRMMQQHQPPPQQSPQQQPTPQQEPQQQPLPRQEQPPPRPKQPPPRPEQPTPPPEQPPLRQEQPTISPPPQPRSEQHIFVTVTFFFSILFFFLANFFNRIKIVEETHITFLGIKIKI